jgi:hypothetical protein
MNYKERLLKMSEATNKIPLNKFVEYYKNIYRVGDCLQAAKKVVERVEGFKSVELNILPIDKISGFVGKHWVATNGKIVVDMTFPEYAKAFMNNNIASSWHKQNKNNVLFNMGINEFEKKFKEIK